MDLKIKWQRLVSEGETCERCRLTENEIDEAAGKLNRALEPLGIDVSLEKETLSMEEFEENPAMSNMVQINGEPLEEWIGASTGGSECCDVCGSEECRTVVVGDKEYEVVPADLVIRAGLKATTQVSNNSKCCADSGSRICCE